MTTSRHFMNVTLQKARANRPGEPATAAALVPSAEAHIWRNERKGQKGNRITHYKTLTLQ